MAVAISAAATSAFALERRYHVATQVGAFAPNAGGQEAYALKIGTNTYEINLFSNRYLLAGGAPMTGAIFDLRLPVCDDSCFWQFYLQAGAGASTGGPMTEITWASVIPLLPIWLPRRAPKYVPALRLDITSQMIFLRNRAVTWSYPLWVGVSVPF